MTKSKAIVAEKKDFNPELTNCLISILDELRRFKEYCLSDVAGAFVVSHFIRVFAQQKNYLDNLRQEAAEAIKTRDSQAIERASYRLDNAIDNRSFDYVWSEAANMYDSIISAVIGDQSSDKLIGSFKTADEILKDCRNYSQQQKEQQLNDKIKTLQALLNIS